MNQTVDKTTKGKQTPQAATSKDIDSQWRLNQAPKLEQLSHGWYPQLCRDFELEKYTLPHAHCDYCGTASMGPYYPTHVLFEFLCKSSVCHGTYPPPPDPEELIGCSTVVAGGYSVVVRDAYLGEPNYFHGTLDAAGKGGATHLVGGYVTLSLWCEFYEPVPIDPALIPDIKPGNIQPREMHN